jgi:hypothetical protein
MRLRHEKALANSRVRGAQCPAAMNAVVVSSSSALAVRLRGSLWWLLPLAFAATLRLGGLPGQVLIDDEIHALRYAHERDTRWLLTNYSRTDYGRPLALLYKAYWKSGIPLGEMGARLPGVIAGLLLVVGVPRAARRAGLTEASGWLAWLLAISPLLVFHSRIARTYMPATLLAQAAVWCALIWMERGGRLWAGAYAVCAALAAQWHLVVIPFVLLPLPFAAAREWLVPIAKRRGWWALTATATAAVGGLLALQAPAVESLVTVLSHNTSADRIVWDALLVNARLQMGSRSALVAFLLLGLALLGLWRLRCRPVLLAYTLTLAAGHVAALLFFKPLDSHIPHILARYLIVALPLLLLWVACGLAHAAELTGSRLAGVAVLLLVAATGPFAQPAHWRSTLSHHVSLLRFDCSVPEIPPAAVPRFYAELGREPGSAPLIEFPWDLTSASRAALAFQLHHRQAIIGAPPKWTYLDEPVFRLHWLIAPKLESFLASSARYLVVHRHPQADEQLVVSGTCPGMLQGPAALQVARDAAAPEMERELRARWGPPTFDEGSIVVWDLARLRSTMTGSSR